MGSDYPPPEVDRPILPYTDNVGCPQASPHERPYHFETIALRKEQRHASCGQLTLEACGEQGLGCAYPVTLPSTLVRSATLPPWGGARSGPKGWKFRGNLSSWNPEKGEESSSFDICYATSQITVTSETSREGSLPCSQHSLASALSPYPLLPRPEI